jgi:hypothetical protein
VHQGKSGSTRKSGREEFVRGLSCFLYFYLRLKVYLLIKKKKNLLEDKGSTN